MKRLFLCLVPLWCVSTGWSQEIPKLPPARVHPVFPHELRETINLDGEWNFKIDPKKIGAKEKWFSNPPESSQTIKVPGGWEAQGVGERILENRSGGFHGTKVEISHAYTGPAWYFRTVKIPAAWAGKQVWIKFGGVHPYGEFWCNGKKLGSQKRYFEPFQFNITSLVKPGEEAKIVACVDNTEDFLKGAFNMAHVWGGLHRGVELEATASDTITRVEITPSFAEKKVRLTAYLNLDNKNSGDFSLTAQVGEPDKKSTPKGEGKTSVKQKEIALEFPVSDIISWSPENPHLYKITLRLEKNGKAIDDWSERIGFVDREVKGPDLYINGKKVFLRGFGDDSVYPETLAFPAGKEEYLWRLKKAREHGFDYVRLHTTIPPPEYFQAADEVGIMVQPELPRGGTDVPHLALLMDNYWNHASLTTYNMNNEAAHRVDDMKPLVAYARKRDPSRWVMDTDGCYIHQVRDGTDIMAIHTADLHRLPGSDVFRYDEETMRDLYSKKPVVFHEYANVPAIPKVSILDAYKGPFQANYVKDLKKWMEQSPYKVQIAESIDASHDLQKIFQIKHLNFARAQGGLDGYSFWTISSFYQHEQGFFDMLWRSKKWTPEEMLDYNDDAVIVGQVPATAWKGETIQASISISNYREDISGGKLYWKMFDEYEKTVAQGEPLKTDVREGEVKKIELPIRIPDFPIRRRGELKLMMTLSWGESEIHNEWPIYFYNKHPQNVPLPAPILVRGAVKESVQKILPKLDINSRESKVVVSDHITAEDVEFLKNGGRMLLTNMKDLPFRKSSFHPGWWQPKHDAQPGFAISKDHPALNGFPHSDTAGLQFASLIETDMAIDRLPFMVTPVIYGISHPMMVKESPLEVRSNLFEFPVGNGMLLISGLNLTSDTPESRSLLDTLIHYISGPKFVPKEGAQDGAESLEGNLAHLKIAQSIQKSDMHPDDTNLVTVKIRNDGLLPIEVQLNAKLPEGVKTFQSLNKPLSIPGRSDFEYSYYVKVSKAGTYEIPAAEIAYGEHTLKSTPLSLTADASADWTPLPKNSLPQEGALIWDFDKPLDGATIPDASGKHKASATHATQTFGIEGAALHLKDGKPEIPFPENLKFENSFSVAFWVKINNGDGLLFSKGDADHLVFGAKLFAAGNILFYFRNAEGTSIARRFKEELEKQEWYHITLSYTPEKVRIYLDGELVTDEAGVGLLKPNNASLVFGEGFDCLLDGLTIYPDKAITPSKK